MEQPCPQSSQFVEESYPHWHSLRSPDLCLVLHVPVVLAGPGCKAHSLARAKPACVFSLWTVAWEAQNTAIDHDNRGASSGGCKALCVEQRI